MYGIQNIMMKRHREGVFFERGNVEHAGSCWEWDKGFKYHLYLIADSVNLKGAVELVHGDCMHARSGTNARFSWLCAFDV